MKMKNLYESQFCRFCNENIVYLAFKFALTKNQSGWLTTSHIAQLHFSFLLFTFFRLNWVGYLFHCNTGKLRKQSFLYPVP